MKRLSELAKELKIDYHYLYNIKEIYFKSKKVNKHLYISEVEYNNFKIFYLMKKNIKVKNEEI
jgi:hypothetical protein